MDAPGPPPPTVGEIICVLRRCVSSHEIKRARVLAPTKYTERSFSKDPAKLSQNVRVGEQPSVTQSK
jgi:hypothetical protein